MAKVGWMNALTWAITEGLITPETARAIVVVQGSEQPTELEQAVALYPVNQQAQKRGRYRQPRFRTAGAR